MACFVEQEAKLVVEWNDSVSQLLKVCAFHCDFIEYMYIVFGMLVCVMLKTVNYIFIFLLADKLVGSLALWLIWWFPYQWIHHFTD